MPRDSSLSDSGFNFLQSGPDPNESLLPLTSPECSSTNPHFKYIIIDKYISNKFQINILNKYILYRF